MTTGFSLIEFVSSVSKTKTRETSGDFLCKSCKSLIRVVQFQFIYGYFDWIKFWTCYKIKEDLDEIGSNRIKSTTGTQVEHSFKSLFNFVVLIMTVLRVIVLA